MKLLTSKTLRLRLIYLPAFILLLAGLAHAATPTKKFDAGKKAKITGTIVSRNGDLVTIKVKKESTSAIVNITDNTKIEREKSFRLRKADEDVTGLPLSRNTCATPPNVPMRRILTPAGYGATHAAATNADPEGRDINRRVDVKVLVNKGLNGAT
jgi:hypothetical protein